MVLLNSDYLYYALAHSVMYLCIGTMCTLSGFVYFTTSQKAPVRYTYVLVQCSYCSFVNSSYNRFPLTWHCVTFGKKKVAYWDSNSVQSEFSSHGCLPLHHWNLICMAALKQVKLYTTLKQHTPALEPPVIIIEVMFCFSHIF